MSKGAKKMSRKKQPKEADENETPSERFQRVVTTRAKVLGKQYNLINRLPKQPSYDITQENAQKLIDWVNKYHDLFLSRYQPLANGEKQSISKEQEIESIF